jgi:hypothetical protein
MRDALYFNTSVQVPDKAGLDPIVADLELSRGILLQGKLTDKATGKPAAGMVTYFPLYPNENVRNVPGFSQFGSNFFSGHSSDEAAADGSFRCLVLPGPGAVCVQATGNHYRSACVDPKAFFKGDPNKPAVYGDKQRLSVQNGQGAKPLHQEDYQAIALINPGKEVKTITCDLALESDRRVKGVVFGPDGKPLAGASARDLRGSPSPWEKIGEAGEFSMVLPHPERPRTVLFRHEEKRLVGQLTVTGREEELTVRLLPWGTLVGRLIAKDDGEPLPDMLVHQSSTERPVTVSVPDVEVVKTDKDGRFVLAGLIPGKKYNLRFLDARDPKKIPQPSGYVVKDLILQIGETRDLGNVVAVYDTPRE